MPVKSTTATEITNKLQDMFNFVGFPEAIVSDNGPPFTSWEFTNLCQQKGIKLLHSPLYHPESNGMADMAVQDIKLLLKRKLAIAPAQEWKQVIKQIKADIRFAKTPL